MLTFKILGWFQWSWWCVCFLSSVGTVLQTQKQWYYATYDGQCPLNKKQGVCKASSDRQKEQNLVLTYWSEIIFKKGKAGSWFPKIHSAGKQFIGNHLLHWFSLLFCLQTFLQQTSNFTVLLSWVIHRMFNEDKLYLVNCLKIVVSVYYVQPFCWRISSHTWGLFFPEIISCSIVLKKNMEALKSLLSLGWNIWELAC